MMPPLSIEKAKKKKKIDIKLRGNQVVLYVDQRGCVE